MRIKPSIKIIFLGLSFLFASEDETEALEVGGTITVDYVRAEGESNLGIGTVELAANVNVAPNVVASITLLSEEDLDLISIDAALVEWQIKNSPVSIIFGQQDFGHGLVTTRLINDPSIIDIGAELIGPGLIVNSEFGLFAPTLGVSYMKPEVEEAESEELDTTAAYYVGIVGYNLNLSEEIVFRNTFSISEEMVDVTAGGSVGFMEVTFDVEGYLDLTHGDKGNTGYYVGANYAINDYLELATRYDEISVDAFENSDKRVTVGPVVSFEHGIFIAAEYARILPNGEDAVDEFSIQMGLESSVKLPGFNRKTLTYPNN